MVNWCTEASFAKGSDGNIYKMLIGGFSYVFDPESMNWIFPDLSLYVSVWEDREYMLIKNNEMYSLRQHGSTNSNYVVYHQTTDSYGNSYINQKAGSIQAIGYRLGEDFVFFISGHGILYAYMTTNAETSDIRVQIADKIQRVEFLGDKLIAYEDSLGGTKIYEIYIEAGILHYNQVSEVVYDRNVFIIKPLFSI
jgi:hypothetical protein